jgi:hypothetical protein
VIFVNIAKLVDVECGLEARDQGINLALRCRRVALIERGNQRGRFRIVGHERNESKDDVVWNFGIGEERRAEVRHDHVEEDHVVERLRVREQVKGELSACNVVKARIIRLEAYRVVVKIKVQSARVHTACLRALQYECVH